MDVGEAREHIELTTRFRELQAKYEVLRAALEHIAADQYWHGPRMIEIAHRALREAEHGS